MSSHFNDQAGRIASAALAIVFTLAVHGAWLGGMDRDAIAVTSSARTA